MYLLKAAARHAQEGVLDRQENLRHNVVVVLDQQVVIVAHRPGGGILDGQDAVVRPPFLHGPHGLLPGLDVEQFPVLPEILHGRLVAVGAFHALVHHPGPLRGDAVNPGKAGVRRLPVLRQQPVLQPAADGHQLSEELPRPLAVILLGHVLHRLQLLPLPLPVVNRLADGHLIGCHVPAQIHSLLVQLKNLAVDDVQLLPDLL